MGVFLKSQHYKQNIIFKIIIIIVIVIIIIYHHYKQKIKQKNPFILGEIWNSCLDFRSYLSARVSLNSYNSWRHNVISCVTGQFYVGENMELLPKFLLNTSLYILH